MREQIQNPRLPFYRQMLMAAGFPEAEDGTWSDAMIDAVVLAGDEARVAERLHTLLTYGCGRSPSLARPRRARPYGVARAHAARPGAGGAVRILGLISGGRQAASHTSGLNHKTCVALRYECG